MHRPAAVAGSFYPKGTSELTRLLESLCPTQTTPQICAQALMVPHAGYRYSGATAAKAYAAISIPESVIILAPNHTGMGPPISVWPRGTWETPLGVVSIDERLADRFLEKVGDPDTRAHAREHAIETQIPFLQHGRRELKILPIVLGRLSLPECLRIADHLAQIIDKELLVASTDMSHFISRAEAESKDRLALDAVEHIDAQGLYHTVCKHKISMCGFIPTTVMLSVCQRRGFTSARIVSYTDSGAVTGDFESVVAYAAAIIPDKTV